MRLRHRKEPYEVFDVSNTVLRDSYVDQDKLDLAPTNRLLEVAPVAVELGDGGPGVIVTQ